MNASLKKLIATTGLRLSGVVLQTLVLMFVGRVAGPAGVGALQVFLTWTCSLGEGAAAGLPTQAMRKLATMNDDRGAAWGFLLAAAQRMTLIWLGISALLLTAWQLGFLTSVTSLLLLTLSIYCFALYRIASDSLKAFKDVDFSVLVESSLPPAMAGAAILALYFFAVPLSINAVLGCFSLGFFATALVIVLRLMKLLGKQRYSDSNSLRWRDHSPFWVSAIVSISFLNLPFFVLPYFAELQEVGAFALAFKLLNIATTILLLLGAVFGPKFARLTQQQDYEAARSMLVLSRKLSIAAFLPIGLLMTLGFPFIHPWFGSGFESGMGFLTILLVGQLVNAATGLSGQFLNMAGAGAVEMKVQITAVLFALAMTPIAGTLGGATGIAVVYSLTVILRSLGSLWFANRILEPRLGLALQA